jgi:hypothetical protein
MLNRRALVALPALLATPARAEDDDRQPPRLALPRPVQLRPGEAPVTLEAGIATTTDGSRPPLTVRFTGAGAPATTFHFASWYGYARVFALRRLRGRDIVLAAFEGDTGTGTYQEIQAAIGQEDDGTARILALETLHYRRSGPCEMGSWLTIRALPLADGSALRLDQFWRRQGSDCPPRPGGPTRSRLEWATTLGWSGHGPMRAPAPMAGAPAPRRLVEASRAKVMAWLAAAPRNAVTAEDIEALGLLEVMAEG